MKTQILNNMFMNIELRKRVFRAALFVLLLTVVGLTKVHAQDFVYQGLKYRITGTNTVRVIGHELGDEATGLLSIPRIAYYGGKYYTVTSIGGRAFAGCTGLSSGQSFSIPNSVTKIGNFAFSGCIGLSGNLIIPNSVTEIGDGAFYGCSGFNLSLTVSESLTDVDVTSFYGTNFNSVYWNAVCCNDISPLSGYDGLFEDNVNLKRLCIGANVQCIPAYSFYGCSHLIAIESQAEIPPVVANNVFNGVNTNINVKVPCGLIDVYQAASGWNAFLIMESDECEYFITGLPDPTYAGSVSGSGTYSSGSTCTLIAESNPGYYFVGWTENETQISTDSAYAFTVSSDRLLVAHFQQQLYTIDVSFFPTGGGTVMGSGTFTYGTQCSVTAIPNPGFLFENWTEDGTQVSTDESYTFNVTDSRNLVANFVLENIGPEQIVFADANVKAICVANWDTNGDGELSYDEAAAVTSISTKFEKNTTITSFDEFQYFIGVTTLTGGTKPSGTPHVSLQYGAFYCCTNLTSIIIPNSVTEIKSYGLYGCSSLSSLTVYAETPPTLGTNAFYYVDKSIPVYVPCAASNAYMAASGWNEFTNYHGMDCLYHQIVASANPAEGGTVTGADTYAHGTNCTLTAKSNIGYAFLSWTENGNQVSLNSTYTFNVTESRTLVANFIQTNPDDNIIFADENVRVLCIANWDADEDGELSYAEAAAVTDLGNVFANKTTITSFDELQYFTGLTRIHGGYSFVNIGNNIMQEQPVGAFSKCINLTSIIIPNTVTSLYCAFSGCESLASIVIPNSVISIGRGTFERCYSLTSIEIPDSVLSIDKCAFYQCTGLATLNIGKSVETIGDMAFCGCSNLTSLTVSQVIPPTLSTDVFYNVNKTIPVNVFIGAIPAYQTSFGWSEFTNYQGMEGSNCEIIAEANPCGCGVITGTGTYSQGEACALTASANSGYYFVNWTENGIQVSSNAIYTFVVSEARNVIANFTTTSNITFADENVKAICIANWDTNGDGELSYNEAAAVTDLGYVFEKNKTITSFDEFQYFTGVSALNGYHTIELIGPYPSRNSHGEFCGCSNLTSIILPNGVATIGENVFMSCGGLVSIDIPNSVTVIDEYAFTQCTGLTTLSIGSSVKTISVRAFHSCSNLISLTSYSSIPPILGANVFGNVDKTIPVYVPYGKVAAYQTASGWNEFANIQELEVSSYEISASASPATYGAVTIDGVGVLVEIDFEDSSLGEWTVIDADGDGCGWELASSPVSYLTSGNSFAGSGHNASTDFVLSGSYSDIYQILSPDNYFVSPLVALGGTISFYACALDPNYAADHFGVAVSTTGNTNPADFTTIQEWTMSAKGVAGSVSVTRSGNRGQGAWCHYTVDLSAYSGAGYVAIRHFDCTDMFCLAVDDIKIEGGSFVYSEGQTCTLTAVANEGYGFAGWTKGGQMVSADATYSFMVNSEGTYQANFEVNDLENTQTIPLSVGWNWCSFNVEITLEDLQNALVTALPGTSIMIKSETRSSTYNGSRWRGTLNSLDMSQMYKVSVDVVSEIALSGIRITSDEHPVTIHGGPNWITFPLVESVSLTDAFAGFAVNGDMVKSNTVSSTYNGSSWRGALKTLEPGKGYVYKSASTSDRTYVFPENKK